MNKLSFGAKSWLQRLAAGAALVIAIVGGVALSTFLFSFFLILAALLAVWLGWKRWQFRRKYGSVQRPKQPVEQIIQGEYEVVREDYIVHQDKERPPQ